MATFEWPPESGSFTAGDLTDTGTDGIVITGGTGAVNGSGTQIAQHVADSTHNGYLSSIDWSTFNGKQASGNYITALTGDVTASGPGSVASTVAKIQGTTVSGTSGTGNVAFTTSPVFTTPNLGTPSAIVLTNASGSATGLTAVTTSGVTRAGAFSIGNSGTTGTIRIGTSFTNATAINVGGTQSYTGAATETGIKIEPTFTSSATTAMISYNAAPQQAAGITTTWAANYVSRAIFAGSGSTITNGIEFLSSDAFGSSQIGATNTAVLADSNNFTGTWFVNQNSSKASIFGGVVSLKTLKFGTAGTTGSTTNTLGANGPNSTTTPNTWVAIQLSDGSTGYMPVWK